MKRRSLIAGLLAAPVAAVAPECFAADPEVEFIRTLNRSMVQTIWYGNTATNPEMFVGFPRRVGLP